MKQVVSIGTQSFEFLRKNNYFFVDKTDFIKEWWENGDAVTLITRQAIWQNTEPRYAQMFLFKSVFKER